MTDMKTKSYLVSVRAVGQQTWAVEATSKADALRRVRAVEAGQMFEAEANVEPLHGELNEIRWSTAKVWEDS